LATLITLLAGLGSGVVIGYVVFDDGSAATAEPTYVTQEQFSEAFTQIECGFNGTNARIDWISTTMGSWINSSIQQLRGAFQYFYPNISYWNWVPNLTPPSQDEIDPCR
jgi:hypothetical protein